MFKKHTVPIIICLYRFKLEKYRQKKMLIGVVTVGDYHEQGFVGTPV